jgi:pyruvate dehydrogenase phosphatase
MLNWRSVSITAAGVGGLAALLMQTPLFHSTTTTSTALNSWRQLQRELPKHPSRLFTTVARPSLLAILRENQYSLSPPASESQSIICRVDVNSIASNEPVEDRHSEFLFQLGQNRRAYMIGVYDGHAGHECAHTIMTELPVYCAQDLSSAVNASADVVKKTLTKTLERMDQDLMSVALDPKNGYTRQSLLPAIAGSVAAQAVVLTDDLYVANTGDVRAVLGRRQSSESADKFDTIEMSRDHHAEDEEERQRVIGEHPESEQNHVLYRNRILGGLQPTRAFGDCRYKWSVSDINKVMKLQSGLDQTEIYRLQAPQNYKTPPYVIARPDVFHRKLDDNDEFLIVASDGLWDWVSNEEAVEIVRQYLTKPRTADPEDPRKFTTNYHLLLNGGFLVGEMNAATYLIAKAIQNVPDKLSNGKPNPDAADPLQFAKTLLAVPAPYSRRYRDDITVSVVFFRNPHVGQYNAISGSNNITVRQMEPITELPTGGWSTRVPPPKTAKL